MVNISGHGSRGVLQIVLALSVGLAWAELSIAQTVTGELVGTVKDPSNAAVPEATVKIVNQNTRSIRTVKTDESGSYYAGGLFVGIYQIEAEAAGFKRFIAANVPVRAAQIRRVDIVLELGAEAQTITVLDAAPAVQSESATLATALSQKLISDKAVSSNTRASYAFDQLMWTSGSSAGSGGRIIFGGARQAQQQTAIEGVSGGERFARPPMNAVGELTTVLTNAPAEYARPVTLNASFRSGSNQLHGEWQEDFLNNRLNAVKTPFFRGARQPSPTTWRHMFSVGGPVVIPKLYDGRNKTFFFLTGLTIRGVTERVFTTYDFPTQRMQAGDFSRFSKTIIDPRTGQAFAGNIIPAERINSVARTYIQTDMNRYAQYFGDPDNFRGNVFSNGFSVGDRHLLNPNHLVLRLDQNVGSSDTVNFTYMRGPFGRGNDGTQQVIRDHRRQLYVGTHVFSFLETHTFSPKLMSQTRLGTQRWRNQPVAADSSGNIVEGAAELKRYGIQGITGTPDGLSGGPRFTFTGGWASFGRISGTHVRDSRFQGNQNFTIIAGAHTFKTGVSAIKLHEDNNANTETSPFFGGFTFDGRFTGDSWSDFLLGAPGTITRFRGRVIRSPRRWELGAFFQDDYKVTPKLTLSYGLRWDKFTVPFDKNRLYYNFDLKSSSIVVPDQFARQNVNPAWPTAQIPVRLANEVGLPDKLQYGRSDISPRFGFAYRPSGSSRTVIRGGYGTFTGAVRFNSLQMDGAFGITESFVNSLVTNADGTRQPLYSFPNPFPATQGFVAQNNVVHVSPRYRTPFIQNWNLTFEQQLIGNWAVRSSYKGLKSTQLAMQTRRF